MPCQQIILFTTYQVSLGSIIVILTMISFRKRSILWILGFGLSGVWCHRITPHTKILWSFFIYVLVKYFYIWSHSIVLYTIEVYLCYIYIARIMIPINKLFGAIFSNWNESKLEVHTCTREIQFVSCFSKNILKWSLLYCTSRCGCMLRHPCLCL